MVVEETVYIKENGALKKVVYTYSDDKVGHPISSIIEDLSPEEIESFKESTKPKAISIDPMDLLKTLTDAEFTEVAGLINASPVVAGFFTRPSINLDATTANRMQSMIDSAGLTEGTTATLTGLIAGLKAKMKV